MLDLIKSLSFKTEFFIVIIICFGYSILGSVIIFLNNLLSGSNLQTQFTNESLLSSVIFEIAILIIVFTFLKARGHQINYSNNMSLIKLTGFSLLLTIVYYLTYFLLIYLVAQIFSVDNSVLIGQIKMSHNISPLIIVVVSIINAFFEESIVVDYIISSLSIRKGMMFAINVSILIRFLYHLYQGPVSALSIIPMGLIFAFVFMKWKNIWPLIIAHGIMDFVALYTYDLW